LTTSAFPILTSVEQVFYDLIWTPMFTAGENWLEVEVPLLDLPIVKQLDEAGLKVLSDAIFQQLTLFIDVSAIKLVNAARQNAYDNASLQLKIVAQTNGINSDAYKAQLASTLAAMSKFTDIAH